MEIETATHGNLLVVAPKGRIDSNTSPDLEAALMQRIEGGEVRISIDFSGVDYISSAGLRVLLMAAKRTGAAQGRFSMHAMAPEIREVFEISGFLSILKVHDSLEGVLAAG